MYKTIKHDEEDFHFVDGLVIVPRAMIQLTKDCPDHYKKIIEMCYNNGWLEVVANMRDSEFTWELIQQ
jgi:hypothetical protein